MGLGDCSVTKVLAVLERQPEPESLGPRTSSTSSNHDTPAARSRGRRVLRVSLRGGEVMTTPQSVSYISGSQPIGSNPFG